MKRNNKAYPITEIIPARKLKILSREKEDFLVVKRTEKGLLVTGLQRYLRGIGTRKRRVANPALPKQL